jgi:predicted CXXCH cytochrome family protein
MAIYERRLDEKRLEPEDHLLVGSLHQRRGQTDAAARAWKKVLEAGEVSPHVLEELARLCVMGHRWEEAIPATERLIAKPGWEARGAMLLGTIRAALNNVPGAAKSFRRALELDPAEVDNSQNPIRLRKLIAQTFLRMRRPDEARVLLQFILARGPDAEAAWLLSRVYLQEKDKAHALEALERSGTYRADNPLESEPGPYVGEVRCEKCHSEIYHNSLASRHTRTYYRGAQLDLLPHPEQPLRDPEDRDVTHTIRRRAGALTEQTRVGSELFDAVIEYAFGTSDRYLTMVTRDTSGRYRIARLSYYNTPQSRGWDRSILDTTHPTRANAAEFQGEAIGMRDGLAKCLYCHVTNPRTGQESLGPELDDRAIGCERCHGPGGNHLAALDSGFSDRAIVNPAGASPQTVTSKMCNDCHILDRRFRDADTEIPGWVRSQGVGWTLSRCNTESGGAFGCVTCHDPHKTARATSTAQYEAKCLNCHGSKTQPAELPKIELSTSAGTAKPSRMCPVDPSKGCIKCHMPPIQVELLHQGVTDHYIRLRRPSR